MFAAVVIETAGAVVSLTVLRVPEMTVPATVCDAVTTTVPSGRLRTSTAPKVQLPPVQATVLQLFKDLQERFNFACLFITHDLAVVDMLAQRIGVLYRGKLIEVGTGAQVLGAPEHAYTKRLIASLPVPDPVEQAKRREELNRLR